MVRPRYGVGVLRVGRLVAMALVIAAAACGPLGDGGASPSASPAPGGIASLDSRAADLRVRLNVLLGEHVMVIAKQADAAAAGRTDEYAGYATLLTTNRDDLVAVMTSAFGASAAARFEGLWSEENDHLVDYTIGAITHNGAKAKAAMSDLLTSFVPRFAEFISSVTPLSADGVSALGRDQAGQQKAFIDDLAGKSYARFFADLRAAYGGSAALADALASGIATRFADKFPGAIGSKGVELRVKLNSLLQEDSYLASMTTGSLAGSRNTEQAAAGAALTASATALAGLIGDPFGADAKAGLLQVLGDRNAELVIYSSTNDDARRQGALSALTGAYVQQLAAKLRDIMGLDLPLASPAIQVQVQSLIDVVDDQLAPASAAQIADDDRTAAATMLPLADLIAAATVTAKPEAFA